MNITDLMGQEVIHLNRPLRCQMCCFPCCLQVSPEPRITKPKQTINDFLPNLCTKYIAVLLMRLFSFNRRWRCPVLQAMLLEPSLSNGAFSIRGQTLLMVQWSPHYAADLFRFLIKDELGTPVLKVEGPCWTCSCCGSDVEFNVLSVQTGEMVTSSLRVLEYNIKDFKFQVGKITKQWTGLGKELFTDADNFGINFPLDLDVKVRLKFT